MIHGDDLYVLCDVGGSMAPIAAAKSGDLEVSQDFIKVCAPTEGRTFRRVPTTYDWSISCDCLMTTDAYAKTMIDAVRNGTEFTLQFTACGWKVLGSAFVKSARIQASKGGLAKLSISFEASGPLIDGTGWDFINGTLYTYSNFSDGTLTTDGIVTDGTLAKDTSDDESGGTGEDEPNDDPNDGQSES